MAALDLTARLWLTAACAAAAMVAAGHADTAASMAGLAWVGTLCHRAHRSGRTLTMLGKLTVALCLGFACYALAWLIWTTLLHTGV